MFYTTLWCNSSEENFKRSVPLHLLGKSLLYYKSQNQFCLVFLEGLELLSEEYIESLKGFGFEIIDYSKPFSALVKKFDALDKFYGTYERNCYLRWIALKELILNNGNRSKQFWHLDSDVFLHASLDEMALDTAGKTFMLQGCPVFLSVSDMNWFTTYEIELQKLNEDIIGYCKTAALEKDINRINDRALCNESLYANPFTHDQDLIEYLVSSKKIIQDSAHVIFKSRFYFIQNVLSLYRWHKDQGNSKQQFQFKENHKIYIDDKIVPFIHYQNTFVNYANVFILLHKLFLPTFLKRNVLRFEIEEDSFKTSLWFKISSKFLKVSGLLRSREEIMEHLSNPMSRINIVTLLNFMKG